MKKYVFIVIFNMLYHLSGYCQVDPIYALINGNISLIMQDTSVKYQYFFRTNPISINFLGSDKMVRDRFYSKINDYLSLSNLDSLFLSSMHISDTFIWNSNAIKINTLNNKQVDSLNKVLKLLYSERLNKRRSNNSEKEKRITLIGVSYPIFIDSNHVIIAFDEYEIGTMFFYNIEIFTYTLDANKTWIKDRLIYSSTG